MSAKVNNQSSFFLPGQLLQRLAFLNFLQHFFLQRLQPNSLSTGFNSAHSSGVRGDGLNMARIYTAI